MGEQHKQHQVAADSAVAPIEGSLIQFLNEGLVLVKASSGSLMLIDGTGEWLEIFARLGPPHAERKGEPRYWVGEGSIAGWVAKTSEAYLCPDVEKDPHFAPSRSGKLNFRSLLSVPIVSGDSVIGVINADDERGGYFSQEDLKLLSAFAAQLPPAVAERARLSQILDSLHEVGTSLTQLSAEGALADALEKIAQQAVSVLNIDLVTLYQYDQSTKRFLVEGTGPTIAGELREPGPMKTRIYPDDVPWKIVESGESRFLSDAQHDPFLLGVVRHPGEPERPRFVVREGIVSSAALLLRVGDETVGVMFANYRTPHYFSAEEKRILETFANYAAVAINNARLFRKTRARAEELERLRRVSQAIRGSIDLPEVLQLIVDSVGRALQADIAVLYPHDPVSREFVLEQVVYCGDESSKLVPREPRSHGIVQKTMEKDILIVEDVEDFYISSSAQPSENEFVRRVGIKSFVGASLRAGEEIVGVLFADFQQAHMFTDTEINTIRAFADQAAIAIQNTRLYERTSEVLQLKIQELQSTQDELLDAERWETLGKAAFSLAHRINNTTGLVPVAIQDAAELLAGVPMDAERRRDLEADLDRIERNTRFTLDLAGMLLKPFIAPPSEECSVNVLVKEAISVANIPDGVDLVTLLSERLPTITTSRLLVDVFVELITNAIQAMPKGGRLEIGSHLRKDDWIEVWLSDTGHGIAPEDQRRVFDLFFTTSEERLGFGLWWVNTFLIQQGATITLESVVGRGSTFTVRLPVDSGTETQ